MVKKMLPEKRLILTQLSFFCRLERGNEISSLLSDRLLSDGMDWGRYLDLCGAHGLEGVVYYTLKKSKLTDSLPAEVIAHLKNKYYRIAACNIRLMDQLQRITTAFEETGLSLLPTQGTSLVETVYPSLGTRPMADMDLLVKKREWPEARQLLQRLGFSPRAGLPGFFSRQGVILDIHFDLGGFDRIRSRRYAVRIPHNRLWAEAVSSADSHGRRTLSDGDTLLYLAAHLQKHSFSRLIWFLDVALLIQQHGDINWPVVWDRAQEFNLTKCLYFVLHALRSVLGIELPETIERRFKPGSLNLVERRFLRALLDGEEMGLVGDLLMAFSVENPGDRLRLLAETAFPRREIMSQIYPRENQYAFLWTYPQRSLRVLVEAFRLLAWLLKTIRPGGSNPQGLRSTGSFFGRATNK